MKVLAVLERRRTIRKFRDTPVPRELVQLLVKAGSLAPSAHDLKPWRIVAVDDVETKTLLAEASSRAYLRSLNSRKVDGAREKAERARLRLTRAPAILVVCLDTAALRQENSYQRRKNEWIMGTQSVSAMVQNILLQASEVGLGACWRGAALFIKHPLRKLLKLPDSFEPQALVEIGYPASLPSPRKTQKLGEILRFNSWSEQA